MSEAGKGWNCWDPEGLLTIDTPRPAIAEHELMQAEPQKQFDPEVLEVGGLVPSVLFEAVQSS